MAKSSGFTIVETLIFLAVSAVMFVSAMLLIGGSQRKTQFNTTTRDFESNIIDIANDIATGYYQSNGSIGCGVAAGEPTDSSPVPIGTNDKCILVGRVISSNGENYTVQSIMGLRTKNADGVTDVTSLNDAKPRLITAADATTTKPIGYGATIECIRIDNQSACNPNVALAFFTNLQKSVSTFVSGDSGGGINAVMYSYNVTPNLEAAIRSATYGNPVKKATICVLSGTTNQHADITIGLDDSSNLGVTTTIATGACS